MACQCFRGSLMGMSGAARYASNLSTSSGITMSTAKRLSALARPFVHRLSAFLMMTSRRYYLKCKIPKAWCSSTFSCEDL